MLWQSLATRIEKRLQEDLTTQIETPVEVEAEKKICKTASTKRQAELVR